MAKKEQQEKLAKPKAKRRWGTTGKYGASLQTALQRFFNYSNNYENFYLHNLWDNWPMVMGEELYRIALPLGAKDGVLTIGAEDNMLLHELSFFVPQMLARANAFMNEPYFKQIRLELLQNRKPLYPRTTNHTTNAHAYERPKPKELGALMNKIDPESAVGQAYISYVESFKDTK
ncbi:DUF721 domain-containing protein [Desulfovibrio sp. OttesenSCG-928-F07]|nr:DUF721 domain-containing protein [Desulfovibrio sp. OttesenSCG-928-F07]